MGGVGGTPRQTLVRRDIWELEANNPWDPVTLAYANAIKVLQSRPASDPTSWTYLSAVHGTTASPPAGANWNQCQHGSWYFLPWHRMYVYYFERIVRRAVRSAGGPADWALPYWNYSAPGRASLPAAFRQRTMPDGSRNPLFVAQRVAAVNNGGSLPPTATDTRAALATARFAPPPEPGFGGGITRPQHFFDAAGELEFTPHNIVHSLIGGPMGDPNRAASDPIFWLHHCNIDRLWEQWLRQPGRANPTDPQWRSQAFRFNDETGATVRLRCDQILDTSGQLGYTYQGLARRAVAEPGGPRDVSDAPAGPPPEREQRTPELVGASERPVVLSGAAISTDIAIDQRTVAARAAERDVDAPPRVLLSLEDIQAERNPELGYEVYVEVPGHPHVEPQFIGTVSFFGIEHVSGGRGRDDGPHGFRRVFDITEVVGGLQRQRAWDERQLRVSFRPIAVAMPPEAASRSAEPERRAAEEAQQVPVSVGRVSLRYH